MQMRPSTLTGKTAEYRAGRLIFMAMGFTPFLEPHRRPGVQSIAAPLPRRLLPLHLWTLKSQRAAGEGGKRML
jgi:hypothetical protein